MAINIIVHLTIIDQVSLTEVQNLLTKAIDSVPSQEIIDSSDSLVRFGQMLKDLLIRLSTNEPTSTNRSPSIDMINETDHIPIPAAVFQPKK